MDASQVSLGPVVESLSVGGVLLRGQYVDAIYGDSRLGVEVSCPLPQPDAPVDRPDDHADAA